MVAKNYVKVLKKLVIKKWWNEFVDGDYFVVPSHAEIWNLVMKDPDLIKLKVTKAQAISTIARCKVELKKKIEKKHNITLNFKPAVWGQPFHSSTPKILNLIVQEYPEHFAKTPLPGRPAIKKLYKQIFEDAKYRGITEDKMTAKTIYTIATNHKERLVKDCKERRK